MNSTEVTGLCRYVAAMCPAQKMDDATPDAWAHVLRDARVEDARCAVLDLAPRQPWISPAEIRAEVRRIRTRRIEAAVSEPPREVADDPAAYLAWLRADRRAIADGRPKPAEDRGLVRDGKRLRELVAGATPKAAE